MRNDRQQRFSFRKYAVGLVSVVVGCLFFGPAVLAQEQEGTIEPPAIVAQEGKEEVQPLSGLEKIRRKLFQLKNQVRKLFCKSNQHLRNLLKQQIQMGM